jgi:hypothetical protein
MNDHGKHILCIWIKCCNNVIPKRLFLVYSLQCLQTFWHWNFPCIVNLMNIGFLFFLTWYKIVYVKSCFVTFLGSRTNSSNENPWDRWMVLVIANCTRNWILVMTCDWVFSNSYFFHYWFYSCPICVNVFYTYIVQ